MRQKDKPHKMSMSLAYHTYKSYPKCAGTNHMLIFLRSWGVQC
jgi:hypothetical protein